MDRTCGSREMDQGGRTSALQQRLQARREMFMKVSLSFMADKRIIMNLILIFWQAKVLFVEFFPLCAIE